MGKKDMILALIEHYSNGNKAQFANRLGRPITCYAKSVKAPLQS